jgi:hypothetical protein
MREIDERIAAFRARARRHHVTWKLAALTDLGQFDDPRVAQFFITVVIDTEEASEVRTDALRRLREAPLRPSDRGPAASAGLQALARGTDRQLRLHAAIILGDFVDIERVFDGLSGVAADPDEPVELRYNAFTSLQRAGPTPSCLTILRALAADDTFGASARALLDSWGAI